MTGPGVREAVGGGVLVGVGFLVGLGVAHRDGSQGGPVGVGRGVVGFGAAELAGRGVAGGVSSGNCGDPNRNLSLSSFIAAVAWTMNCRHIGPGWLAPNTSYPPSLVFKGLPSMVPSQTAAASARV